MSIPAGILISALCRQVPYGSLQPSTANVHAPCSCRVTSTVHRSLPWPTGVISIRLVCPDGEVSTTFAFTASWPSRKTVAAMVNVSPTDALAGYAPASTVGVTSVIGMRPVMA